MDFMNGVTSANTLLQAQNTAKKDLGQKDFLKLMIAQFQNQDPTQPKTNGDFLAQLAQFSTNDGIGKMQESIQQLATSLQSNQALQASALVGRKVLVTNDKFSLATEGDSKITVDLPAAVDNLTASIYSENGELIRKIPLGQHDIGLFEVNWDGMNQSNERMAAGKYVVQVNGLYEGREVALKTMTAANVDSVSLGQNGSGVLLNVSGIGSVSLDQVKQITA